jgi:predicted RND superfamily exporter protein
VNNVNRFATGLGEFISHHPWRIVFLVIAACGVLMPGASKLTFNDDYRVYFSPENPDLIAWEELLDTYTRADGVIVAVRSRNGDRIFSPMVMPAVRELTERLWWVPHVVRVDSVTNFQHVIPGEDEITVVDLVPAERVTDGAFLQDREAAARREPQVRGVMLSEAGDVTAIYLQMMIPEVGNAIADATGRLREIVADVEGRYPQLDVRLGGLVMLNAAFDEYARLDMATLFPLMIVVMVVIMGVLVRSVGLTVALLLAMCVTVGMTMGLAGYLGIAFSPHSSIAPHIIMTVAVATGIHIALGFRRHYAANGDKRAAVVHAIRKNLLAVAVTSLTTCIGFLSMLLSDVPPFRHLGIMCGIGMLLGFVIAMGLLPALFMLLPVRRDIREVTHRAHWPSRLSRFVYAQRRTVVASAVVLAIPVATGLGRLEVNDHPVELFSKKTEFRQAADFIDEHLAGTTTIQFSLSAGRADGINDPDFLRRVERFKRYLENDAMVRHVTVLTDTIKRINRAMHAGDDAHYQIPARQDEAAQYLLFYEMNLPFGLDLNNQIDIAKSSLRLIATVQSSASKEIIQFLSRTHDWLAENDPELNTRGVSVLVMFALMHQRLAANMLITAGVAVLAIALVLMVALKDWRLGLLSMVPNLLPILAVFGLWSLLGNSLDFAASLIFSMTLGVVVDDTVHFLVKFLDARREGTADTAAALDAAFGEVGPAIVYSTVALAAGFMVFGLSQFHMNVTLGLLSALTFGVAAVLDLFLLPVLLALTAGLRDASLTRAVDDIPQEA